MNLRLIEYTYIVLEKRDKVGADATRFASKYS